MISYIIPTRNRSDRLAATIDALARLSADDHRAAGGGEILVIDNGSHPPVRLPRRLPNGLVLRLYRRPYNGGTASRNVLGVAFSNDRGRRRFASDVNFNSRLNWVFDRAPRTFREYHFGSTCAHEFGHALGLQHSDRGCRALMGGGCGSPGRVRRFSADDIAGAQFLYPGSSRHRTFRWH